MNMAEKVIKPVSGWWGHESARRRNLRTPESMKVLAAARHDFAQSKHSADKAKSNRMKARAGGGFVFSSSRRAAAIGDRMARHNAAQSRRELRAAVAACPETLERRAFQFHLVHSIPTVFTAWVCPDLWLPAAGSLLAVAANILVARLSGRESASEDTGLPEGLSREEKALCARLEPSYWVAHAEGRGLDGTVTGRPVLTPGGIECAVRLDGQWTVKKLAAAEDLVRSLTGIRTSLRMRVVAGKRGGWATLQFATRSAADGTSSAWTPERMPTGKDQELLMSLGLDTETGEEVLINFDERLLIAGASGTGKSWSSRPLMAHAHLRGDLVLIDAKGDEANVWDGVCRCVVEADDICDMIEILHAEMHRRKAEMKRRRISVWDGPQLTVSVDEGQVALAILAAADKIKMDLGDGEKVGRGLVQKAVELSSLGRARGIVLWWFTQKPIMSGPAPGVHNLIAPNLLQRFSLRVADEVEARTALDDCAHYGPNLIPDDRSYRGHGYLKGYGPRLIKTWTMDDDAVRALPQRVWRGGATSVAASLVKQDVAVAAAVAVEPEPLVGAGVAAVAVPATTQREKVLQAIREGARYAKDVALCTGCNKGNVSRELKRLVEDGLVRRDSDGRLTAITIPS